MRRTLLPKMTPVCPWCRRGFATWGLPKCHVKNCRLSPRPRWKVNQKRRTSSEEMPSKFSLLNGLLRWGSARFFPHPNFVNEPCCKIPGCQPIIFPIKEVRYERESSTEEDKSEGYNED